MFKQVFRLVILVLAVGTMRLSYAEDPILAGRYYENAVVEYRNNNVKAAIIELKNAIQQNPNYLTAYILLAEVYLKDKNLIFAEKEIEQADKLGADPSLLIKTRAQLFLYQLKFSKVLEDIDPQKFAFYLQPDLHIFRGHAYLQLNQLAYALNEYAVAARLDPQRIEPIIGRANVQLRLGNMRAALEAADQAARLSPDSSDGWHIKASIKHAQGFLQDALRDYSKAIKNDESHLDARLSRAGILIDLHRDDEAEIDLVHIRESYPFNAKATYLYALVLARNGREKESVEELTAAAEMLDSIKPEFLGKHFQSVMLAGLVNYSLKRFDLAIDYLKMYIQQFPDQSGSYKLLATILLDRNESERVIKLLRPIVAIKSNDYRLLLLLGRAYMQNGQHDQANAILEKASKLDIKGEDISTELGLNRLAIGQDVLAIKELEKAIKNDPGNSQAGIPLTQIYLSKQQIEKAMVVARKMHENAPENLTLLNLLGTIQAKAKSYKQARQSFEKVLAIDPGFISAHLNLSKLDSVEGVSAQATERLQVLIKQYPKNEVLLIQLATIYNSNGDFSAANDLLRKAIKLNPKSLTARLSLIKLQLMKPGREPKALQLALNARSLFVDNLQILEILARSFLANDNKGKASGVLQNMSRIAGFNAKKLFPIARMQLELGNHSEAMISLKNALLGREDYIPARVALAELEIKHGNPIFAYNHANFLLKRYPYKPFGYRLLGDLALGEGKYVKAVEHYQSAFNKTQNTFILMRLYKALNLSGNNPQAFKVLKQWVVQHDQDSIAIKAYAEELLHAGQLKESQKYYEQLLQQLGKKGDLLNNLAYIYFQLGDDRALSYAQQAQKLGPEQPSANDTLGWILVNKGQAELGLQYLRNAHARSSLNPEIRYHIAQAFYQLKRFDEAKEELQKVLKVNSSFVGSDDARKLLKKLNK